jgi:hypothetical protein
LGALPLQPDYPAARTDAWANCSMLSDIPALYKVP